MFACASRRGSAWLFLGLAFAGCVGGPDLSDVEARASSQVVDPAAQPPSCESRNAGVRAIGGLDNDDDFEAWRRNQRDRCDRNFEPFPPYDPTPCTSACNLNPHLREPVGECQQRCYDLAAEVANYNAYLREQRELCRARVNGPGARRDYNGDLARRMERAAAGAGSCGPCTTAALSSGRSMTDHLRQIYAQESTGMRDVYCVGAGRDRVCRSGGQDVSIPASPSRAAGGYCATPTPINPILPFFGI